MRLSHFGLFALLLLPGCATSLDGFTQTVTIRTAPVGASCTVTHKGAEIARIASTPGTIRLHPDFHDLTVACQKPGWEPTVQVLAASFTGVADADLVIFPQAMLVDVGNGSAWRYDEDRMILMTPPTR
ncbi:hypothetical protein [Acidisphaera sp. L21]|uniref:hypothetical protein n=1 Tax=Acidisphaera sp. L21 TaxID=1641851 RepID=UPI00131CC53B|nr:hypothetical protein [Acidisphaera sp. L21]